LYPPLSRGGLRRGFVPTANFCKKNIKKNVQTPNLLIHQKGFLTPSLSREG